MSYSDYIYEPETGYLRHEKTKSYFLDSSEYSSEKYKKFDNYEDVKRYITEEKFSGSLGIKIN